MNLTWNYAFFSAVFSALLAGTSLVVLRGTSSLFPGDEGKVFLLVYFTALMGAVVVYILVAEAVKALTKNKS